MTPPSRRLARLRRLAGVLLFFGTVAGLGFLPTSRAGDKGKPDPRLAPELDGGVAWLNTAAPVKLSDLRGSLQGNDALEKALLDTVGDENKLNKLRGELGASKPEEGNNG